MYALFSMKWRNARKPHQCIWCGGGIVKNETYLDERSIYDHQFQDHKWHWDCSMASARYFKRQRWYDCEFDPHENERPPQFAHRSMEVSGGRMEYPETV